MKNTIKKILKENDFSWTESVNELPLEGIKDISDQYDKIKKLKDDLEKYMEGKEGLESLSYEERDYRMNMQGLRDRIEKYRELYIFEQVREIYNEINNIEGSLRDLPSSLDRLEYLVTGVDKDE